LWLLVSLIIDVRGTTNHSKKQVIRTEAKLVRIRIASEKVAESPEETGAEQTDKVTVISVDRQDSGGRQSKPCRVKEYCKQDAAEQKHTKDASAF
jgi:hypothetical protein